MVKAYAGRLKLDVARLFADTPQVTLYRDQETGLSFFHPMILGDADFYAALGCMDGYYPTVKREFALARPHIPHGARFCEIGAGAGYFRDHIPDNPYVGLDLSPQAVSMAKTRQVTVLAEDGRDHARRHPHAYDVVAAFQVIEHVADPLSFFRMMLDLVRPGGKIMLSTPNAQAFISRCRDVLNMPPHHVTWWEDETWVWLRHHFGLSGLHLDHTAIDGALLAWARMVAADGLARSQGLELHPIVDESPERHAIDAQAENLAAIIAKGLRFKADAPPVGHTTLAVFTV